MGEVQLALWEESVWERTLNCVQLQISKHGQFEIRGNSLDLPSTSKFNLMIKLRVEDRIGQDEIRFKCKGKGKICFGR
jgi:hypothetical protein